MINLKVKQLSTGIKAEIWYTIGNILIKGIPFLSIPIFTRLLSTSDFGVYNIFISYESILGIILGLGFSGTVKVAKIDFKEKFEEYISSIFKTILIVGGIVLLITNVFFSIFNINLGWLDLYVLNLLIIQSVAGVFYSIMSSKYIIQGKYIQNLVISLIITFLNVSTSIFLCFFFLEDNRLMARIIGTVIGTLSIAVFVIIQQSRKARLRSDFKAVNYALKLGLPLIPHQLSISLLAQSDKIMIQSMIGDDVAGIYGLAVNITMVMTVILSSIDNAWTPNFFKALSEKKYSEITKTNNKLLILFMFLTCAFILIGPDVIHIMSPKVYWESIYAFVPLTVSIFLNFMYIFYVGVEYFMKKTGYISLTTLVCTFINIFLNYFAIKVCGYLGAAYTTCFTRLVLFIMHYNQSHKLINSEITSKKYLFLTFIIICFTGILTIIFVSRFDVRMIILFIISIGILIFLKKQK